MGSKPRSRPVDIEKWAKDIEDPVKVPEFRVRVVSISGDFENRGLRGAFNYLPTRQEIKDAFGPGRYRLLVFQRDDQYKLAYATCKTVEIE